MLTAYNVYKVSNRKCNRVGHNTLQRINALSNDGLEDGTRRKRPVDISRGCLRDGVTVADQRGVSKKQ
jgi:hypothetical protein